MSERGDGRRVEAADALCEVLGRLGTEHVFGLPGTQNMAFTEALRRSRLDWVVPSNELAASFAANGYWRSSGRPAVVSTIPGPGFTWALTGLAEARLDSAAVLLITGAHPEEQAKSGLQEIEQTRMARPVVKQAYRVTSSGELVETVERAHAKTVDGEPGPVLLEIEHPVWDEACTLPVSGARSGDGPPGTTPSPADPDDVNALKHRVASSDRPLLFAGQGAQDSPRELRELAEEIGAPVLLSTSGRGALPESHPLAFPLDRHPAAADSANALLDAADLVVVLGCRLGHNATLGHRLKLSREKLIRVDASRAALEEAEYGSSLPVRGDVRQVLRTLLTQEGDVPGRSGAWHEDASTGSKVGLTAESEEAEPPEDEVRLEGVGAAADFFEAMRRVIPEDGVLVTDSGLHQMLARRYYPVEAPRTLVVPTNFQSMGYGVPAAIGAALANSGRTVVALIGDGGLRLSGFDLATARALDLDLSVIVFADGYFGLIREGQLNAYGADSGVELPEVDLAGLAESLGVPHERLDEDPEGALRRCVEGGGTRMLEVGVSDPEGRWLRTARRRLGEEARRGLGPDWTERLKGWIQG